MAKHCLDPVEEQVNDVVHTLQSRYLWFATFHFIRHAIATATLGILTKLHSPLAETPSRRIRAQIRFPTG